MNAHTAMPEFLERKDIGPRAWSVQEGAPQRGDAWTEMKRAQMRVPYGADALSRVVRAHEMVHAKVSPLDGEEMAKLRIHHDAIVCAEEFRVNQLVNHAGWDLDDLRDGSEFQAGKICGQNNDFNAMVKFATSTFGGKANADFIRGLKATNPVLADEAKEVNKVLRKFYRDFLKRYKHYRHGAHGVMAGTTPTFDEESGAEIPSGFEKFTVPLARAVDRLLQFKAPEEQEAQKDRVSISEVARGQAGIWAKPIELELPKPRHVDGKLGRKRVPANIGKNPRRINRMLLDPERRVFDRRAKGIGGIILIDQSGSMSLSEEDIWNLIESAPGCVIIGYSHQRDSAGVPNIWVLAERGRVVEDLSEVPRNGGNGVDGPAIRFALTKRRNNEPFIWVCDGDVTDGKDDMTYPNLTAECVTLVHTHGIHTVDSVEEAVDALKGVARGNRPKTRYTGELRRVARRKGLL